MTLTNEFNIKGTRLSGRVWKGPVKPVRSIIKTNINKQTKDKIREKWLKSKLHREEMKEISKESRELIEKTREERKTKAKQIKIKRQKKIENEIRSAGNNLIIVGPKKFSKMSKKARKGLTRMTPEMLSLLMSNKR